MDAVILAAGRGTRIATGGIVSEFHKPLLTMGPVIDEYPTLIQNAVALARLNADHITVVVSPHNAVEIDRALSGTEVKMVIQRRPTGPGEALRIGLAYKSCKPSNRVLVMLADNVMSAFDVAAVAAHGTAVGVQRMSSEAARRYTWYDRDERRWREKTEPPNVDVIECWVGPFVGWRDRMETVLSYALPINGEYLIGPYLGEFVSQRIPVTCLDVGTSEDYRNFLRSL